MDVSFEINIMSFTSLPTRQPLHETFVTPPHPSMPDTEINILLPSGQLYTGFNITLSLLPVGCRERQLLAPTFVGPMDCFPTGVV